MQPHFSNDDDELDELLSDGASSKGWKRTTIGDDSDEAPSLKAMGSNAPSAPKPEHDFSQWATSNDRHFYPAARTVEGLPAGVYELDLHPAMGLFFSKLEAKTENLLRFPQTNCEAIVREIQNFWAKEHLFAEYGLAFKRGILMWGPPGSGKTSTIGLLTKDIIERGGIVLKFGDPSLFAVGLRTLRQIEPEKPVVVLMEDIDATLEKRNETDVLNILDGVDRVHKVVFLATTNYPEKLGARIVNRPSRFDKRFKIGHPNPASRRIYFEHLIDGRTVPLVELDRWVTDTEGFSLAHLKELFVAVVILGDEYEEALKTLSRMKGTISSSGGQIPPPQEGRLEKLCIQ